MLNKDLPREPRILLWDCETTNLNAPFGFVLCIGYKWLGEKKTHIIGIDDFPQYEKDRTNDKPVVRAFSAIMDQADVQVTWYGVKFDSTYIDSRLLYHNLAPMAPVSHVDGWWVARKRLRMHSNRLQAVAEFFGVSDKTPVSGPHWVKAMAGDARSLKYVKDHCRGDISTLESVYLKMRPLMTFHPNVNMVTLGNGCPKCGNSKIQKRGWQYAHTQRTQRWQCQGCGGWSRGKPERFPHVRAR